MKLAEETRGRSIITILQAYSLKELYTSDTTLSQMIDWTPPSNELRGKIRSDPPPPWKSWKKLLSVRILHGPVRILYGPVRILCGPVRILYGPVRILYGPVRILHGPVRFLDGPIFSSNAHAGGGGGAKFCFQSSPSSRF